MLYIEADAKMDTYEDNQGTKKTSLNLIQRNFEVLKRPYNPEAAEAAEAAGQQ